MSGSITVDIPANVAEFGTSVAITDVDEWVIALLKTWMPTYLTHLERERGESVGRFKRPVAESYASTLDDVEFPDHKLPAILVTCAQTVTEPALDSSGVYSAVWDVIVSSVVRGRRPKETRWIASIFELAVRMILVHQSLPVQGEMRWAGSRIGAVADPTNAGRYLAAGITTFAVAVDVNVQADTGPITPLPDASEAFDPLAEVDRVRVDVVASPTNEELQHPVVTPYDSSDQGGPS